MTIFRVISSTVFEVEILTYPNKEPLNAQRMSLLPRLYQNEVYTDELLEYAKFGAWAYHIINSIQDIRIQNGKYELKVKWLGSEDADKNWEPIEQLKKNVSREVQDFLHAAEKRNLKSRVLSLFL